MAPKKKLTDQERKRVQDQIAQLQASLDDVADADTEDEIEDAEADVVEKKKALAELFDRLGLTEADYDLLVEGVGASMDEKVRHIVREELGEDGDEDKGDGTVKELADDPEAPPVEDDTPPSSPPASKHWTERKVWGKGEEE